MRTSQSRTPSHGLTAGVAQHAPIQTGVGLGGVQPVGAWVAEAVKVTHRDVDTLRVGAQPVRQQRAGRTAPTTM